MLVLVLASSAEMHFMNPFKTDFGQLIWVDFNKSDFLNIDIFI